MRNLVALFAGALGCAVWTGCAGGAPPEEPTAAEASEANESTTNPESAAAEDGPPPIAIAREPEFVPVEEEKLRWMLKDYTDWRLYCSTHFAVIYHVHGITESDAKAMAKLAETHTLELFRADPRDEPITTPVIRCVKDEDLYHSYGGADRGTYSPVRNEIVVRQTEGPSRRDDALKQLLAGWFRDTSPAEQEKRMKFLEEWAARNKNRGR